MIARPLQLQQRLLLRPLPEPRADLMTQMDRR
jgi:hypothetical protein